MKRQPTVSVVIPCYNASRFLRETLESVLSQTFSPLEVIVVDDGSTDDSAAIAGSLGSPVRVIRQENQGESVARNRGMDEAAGEWIALLDADDVWAPEKLQKQILKIRDETVAVHTNVFRFGNSSSQVDLSHIEPERLYSLEFIAQQSPLYVSSLLVRSAAAPRFPVWTRYAEDMLFQFELVQRGSIELAPEFLTGYREHERNQSRLPGINILWHQSILRWLQQSPAGLGGAERDRIEAAWLTRLVDLAWAAKERRAWQEYWLYHRHLTRFAGDSGVNRLLSSKVYPRVCYSLLDFSRRVGGFLKATSRFRGSRNATSLVHALVLIPVF